MKQKTTLIENNGSFYLRIPPPFKEYLMLEVGENTVEIEDKERGGERYAVIKAVIKNE